MHAEDVPVILGFAAEHHAAARGVNVRGFYGVVVEAPDHVTDGGLIFHRHGKMGVRSQAKIRLLKMIGGLLAAAQFSGRGTEDEIRIEAGGKFCRVRVVERFRAGMHSLLHLRDDGNFCRARRGEAEARDATLQVNGDAELLEEVHAEDSIERGAAGFGESGQVNRGERDVKQNVAAELQLVGTGARRRSASRRIRLMIRSYFYRTEIRCSGRSRERRNFWDGCTRTERGGEK
jgi:hypothetical protein